VIDRPSECEEDVHFLIVELQRRHGASPERGPPIISRTVVPSRPRRLAPGISLARVFSLNVSQPGSPTAEWNISRAPPFESQRGGGRKPWS
jgi:hypothetical protein